MLHLIVGRIGSGKTKKIYEILKASLNKNEEAVLVVPEQYSFETEKSLLQIFGAIDANKTGVFSFTFLAEYLLKKAGVSYKPEVDDATRAMIMSLALEEVHDNLEFYNKAGYSSGFINELIGMIKEFRQCEITPEKLSTFENSSQDAVLKKKVKELSLIEKAYSAIIEQSYLDNETSLDILHENIKKIDFFKNKTVFIDGFRGFTAQELVIIEDILNSAKDVYITICADKITGLNEKTGVFSHTRRTAAKLFKINDKVLKTKVDVIKTEYDKNYDNEELKYLENNFYSANPQKYEKETQNIQLCSAENFYAECDYVAFNVKKLISENGYRCRDIAIISRDSSKYERQIKSALKKYGVPVYIDKRQPVMNQPLMSIVFSALKIAEYGFENESVFRILKTGLTDIDDESVALLENYTNLWQTKGSKWSRDFTGNPKGLGEKMREKDAENLLKINKSRKYVAQPLLDFINSMKDADGLTASKAVYQLLIDFKVDKNLRKFAQSLIDNNEFDLAEDLNRVWEILMNILDDIASATGKKKLNAKRFSELFRVMISCYSMGALPKGLDEVVIGSADRVRVNSPKAVFVVGVCDGEFPNIQKSKKILSRAEREKLRAYGFDLSQTAEEEVMEERFISYDAFCAATEKLYVSYPLKNISGSDCSPSELVEQVKRIFPFVKTVNTIEIDTMEYIRSEESAFQKYAENYHNNDEISFALKKYFDNCEEYNGKMKALKRAVKKSPFKIENEEIATNLFNKDMYVSASRADKYYKCPFGYFCKYGIYANPLKTAELDNMQIGTIVHYVLESLIKEYGSEKLCAMSDDEVHSAVIEFLQIYFEDYIQIQGEMSARFKYMFNNLSTKIFAAVKRLIYEFSVSEFIPVDFELKIDNDGKIQPIEIKLKNGTLKLKGYIDRVDMMKTEDKNFVRVIDYKTGKIEFSLSNVFYGLNMQMLIYLFSIWKNGTGEYENVTPAGVLYTKIGNSVGSFDRNDDRDYVFKEQQKEYKMEGIILDDSRVIEGMDRTKSGSVIPAKYIDKENKFKGTLIDITCFEKLYKIVEDNLKKMGDNLHEGKIEAIPTEKHCEDCDYKSVCGFESGDEIREIPKIKHDECVEILKGGEENA